MIIFLEIILIWLRTNTWLHWGAFVLFVQWQHVPTDIDKLHWAKISVRGEALEGGHSKWALSVAITTTFTIILRPLKIKSVIYGTKPNWTETNNETEKGTATRTETETAIVDRRAMEPFLYRCCISLDEVESMDIGSRISGRWWRGLCGVGGAQLHDGHWEAQNKHNSVLNSKCGMQILNIH